MLTYKDVFYAVDVINSIILIILLVFTITIYRTYFKMAHSILYIHILIQKHMYTHSIRTYLTVAHMELTRVQSNPQFLFI